MNPTMSIGDDSTFRRCIGESRRGKINSSGKKSLSKRYSKVNLGL